MRILELALFILLFFSLILPVLLGRRGRTTSLLTLLTILVMLAHLLIEGYRWQMVPLYALALLTLLGALLGWLRYPRKDSRTSGFGKFLGVLGLLLAGIAVLLPVLFPIPQFDRPTGAYPIGTTTLEMVDTSRTEIYSGKSGEPRAIMVQFWYPARAGSPASLAPWMDHLDVVGPSLSVYLGLPSFTLDHLVYSRSNSYLDASLADEQDAYPVILFSHGWNGVRVQDTFLYEELASHGYVVAAIDHAYGAGVVVFPDGRVAENNPEAMPMDAAPEILEPRADTVVDQWAGDMAFVLDTLAQWNLQDPNNRFTGRLDLEKIGIMGHSTGGGATVEFCGRDPRCQAGIGLDPYLTPVSDKVLDGGVQQPLLFMFSELYWGEKNNLLYQRLAPNSADLQEFMVQGSDHYDFTDLPLLSPLAPYIGLKGPINGPRMLTIVRQYSLAFFNQHLKGASQDGFSDLASKYPEVIFDRLP
jgi:dienelactone hydrolase